MKLRHLARCLIFGLRDAAEIDPSCRIRVYLDMLFCVCRFHLFLNQYKHAELWKKSPMDRYALAAELGKKNQEQENDIRMREAEWQFLAKWSNVKFDKTFASIRERIEAYQRRFNIGKGAWIENGVLITQEFHAHGNLRVGKGCLLARNVDLDYTGGLSVGDNVKIMDGVKILTHGHDMLNWKNEADLIPFTNRAYATPLQIGDNVQIASRAMIMPGVGEIGANSMISAGAVVTKRVPPHVIVAGNPAKVVAEIPEEVVLKAEFLK